MGTGEFGTGRCHLPVYFEEHCATVAVVIAFSEVLAATGTPHAFRFQVSDV